MKQSAITAPLPARVVGGNQRRRRPGRQPCLVAAAARPCVLLTGPDGLENLEGLQLLAAQVGLAAWVHSDRRTQQRPGCPPPCCMQPSIQRLPLAGRPAPQVRSRLGCEALILVPGSSGGAAWAGQLSLDRQLDLRPLPADDSSAGVGGPPAFALDGATGADCVMAGADHTAGLARQLGLSVAMVAVGISRGPALSSGALSGFTPLSGEVPGWPAGSLARLLSIALCGAGGSPRRPGHEYLPSLRN